MSDTSRQSTLANPDATMASNPPSMTPNQAGTPIGSPQLSPNQVPNNTASTIGSLFSLGRKALTTSVTSLNGILPVSNPTMNSQQNAPSIASGNVSSSPLITLATESHSLSPDTSSASKYNERLAAKLSAARTKHNEPSFMTFHESDGTHAASSSSTPIPSNDDDRRRVSSEIGHPVAFDSVSNRNSGAISSLNMDSTNHELFSAPPAVANIELPQENGSFKRERQDSVSVLLPDEESHQGSVTSSPPRVGSSSGMSVLASGANSSDSLDSSSLATIASMSPAELQAKLAKLRRYEVKFTGMCKPSLLCQTDK